MDSQPHLVSLVLQSKKALQHGEHICTEAKDISILSAQTAVDVLALDAKVRWIAEAILHQLKLATTVAISIEEKRTRLRKQVEEWDTSRIERSNALDNVLDSIGSQKVPQHFYTSLEESSIFGSQHSDDNLDQRPNGQSSRFLQESPSETVRISPARIQSDRSKWKNLRDFVDDQAIQDVMEAMENERVVLDDLLSKTDEYPETLHKTISTIRTSLPELDSFNSIEKVLSSQDPLMRDMADRLESLAAHYDQMATALRESEAGEDFSEDDLQDMNRDTEELPRIMTELEERLSSVNATQDILNATKLTLEGYRSGLSETLDDLDELGEIMDDMLQTQESVEVDCEDRLSGLQDQLFTLDQLYDQFISYQNAFSKLILELARRRVYREAAENIVRGMMAQLEAMTEEERLVREHFNVEHGTHLPDDICLCIGNTPTKWEITPSAGEIQEFLPDIENDLILEAKDRVGNAEGAGAGAESM